MQQTSIENKTKIALHQFHQPGFSWNTEGSLVENDHSVEKIRHGFRPERNQKVGGPHSPFAHSGMVKNSGEWSIATLRETPAKS